MVRTSFVHTLRGTCHVHCTPYNHSTTTAQILQLAQFKALAERCLANNGGQRRTLQLAEEGVAGGSSEVVAPLRPSPILLNTSASYDSPPKERATETSINDVFSLQPSAPPPRGRRRRRRRRGRGKGKGGISSVLVDRYRYLNPMVLSEWLQVLRTEKSSEPGAGPEYGVLCPSTATCFALMSDRSHSISLSIF